MEFQLGTDRFYQTDEQGKLLAEVTWLENENQDILINRTFVDPVLRGQGIASELILAVIDWAQKSHRKIIAECPYAQNFFEKHPEFVTVLAD